MSFGNLKAHLQWHTSSIKATPCSPHNTFLPTGDQVLKNMSQWGLFSLKLPHPALSNIHLSFSPRYFVSLLTISSITYLNSIFFCETSISKCILGSLTCHPPSPPQEPVSSSLFWIFSNLSASPSLCLQCVDLLHTPLGLNSGIPKLYQQTPSIYLDFSLHAPFSATKSFMVVI